MRSKSQRNVAILLGIVILLALLLSAFCIVAEIDHDCTGENCPICACIQQCENNIRQMGDGTVAMIAAVLLIAFFLLPSLLIVTNLSQATLVTQKVRLNN